MQLKAGKLEEMPIKRDLSEVLRGRACWAWWRVPWVALVLAEAGHGRGQEEPGGPPHLLQHPWGQASAQAAGCVQPAEVAGASWSLVIQGPVV